MAKCFSCPGDCKELSKKTKRDLATVEDCRRKQGDGTVRNQGSSQLTVWRWLTRAHRV